MSKANHILPLSMLMRKAWATARAGACRFGGPIRAYLAEALRQAWADLAELTAMRRRVLACAEQIRAQSRFKLAAETGRKGAKRVVALAPRRRPEEPAVTGDEDGFLARLAVGQARAAAGAGR